MGKKSTRSSYTSKGQRSNVSKSTKKAMRRDWTYGDRLNAQLFNWAKGRKTMVTIPNPNDKETNKRFIRVEGNQAFGPWKRTEK